MFKIIEKTALRFRVLELVGGPSPAVVGFEKTSVAKILQQTGNVARVAVDQLLQTGVGGAAFDLNGGQCLERIGGQSGDHGFAKALVQSRDRALRDQAHHGKSHLHAVGPRLGSNQRGPPMASAPPGADFVHTGPRALATTDHQKHLLERGISALTHPAATKLFHRHQSRTRKFLRLYNPLLS